MKKSLERFMNTELQKADDIGFRVEQVIKKKGDKSYVT